MPDKLSIVWSAESSRQVRSITAYLSDNWGKKEVRGFLSKLKLFEELVSRFPKLYPASLKYPKLRKAVISKHQSIIYEVVNNVIRVYTILDHRQKN